MHKVEIKTITKKKIAEIAENAKISQKKRPKKTEISTKQRK